ncbi:hypothetical protein [Actinoplanes sp. GCM10030250]|uniref:hypothetical protein n=1 Tax=Actinoplanes sp. GCM10030250 TaxID=3273376 RepID=UPI003611F67F
MASTPNAWSRTSHPWQYELLDQGVGLLECARRLGWALNTVKRYARAERAEQLQRPPQYRETMVDPFRDHLRSRRAHEPGVAVTQLLAAGSRKVSAPASA